MFPNKSCLFRPLEPILLLNKRLTSKQVLFWLFRDTKQENFFKVYEKLWEKKTIKIIKTLTILVIAFSYLERNPSLLETVWQ